MRKPRSSHPLSGVTSATTVLVEPVPATPARPLPLPPPPRARGDELGPLGRRLLVGGVMAAHVVGGWALLQVSAVREAVAQAMPVLMVDLVAPAEPPPPPPPPPPAPVQRVAPAPTPIIAAAPTPTPTPPAFVAPPPEPAPPPVVAVAPTPPAPPVAQPAPPAPAPGPRQVAASAVRFTRLPITTFPALSRRNGEQGIVVLRLLIDATGALKDVRLHKSSGFERLDQAALMDIGTARFAPYVEDGKAVDIQVIVPIDYSLTH